MKSYLFCLCVCHLKIIFCICICICNFVFLEGGNKAKKKNFEVLDDIFWRGKTKKTVRLIEIQSRGHLWDPFVPSGWFDKTSDDS